MKPTVLQFNILRNFSSFLCYLVLLFPAIPAFADNVRDEFTTLSYSNNDGNANWTTAWLEINEADGVTAGDVQVIADQGSGRLRISGNNKGVQREVNLSGATIATLTFDYRRESLDRGNEYVNVEISSDGGASWTELVRYKGPQTDASYQSSLSYDITPYISANTRFRLLGSSNLDTADAVYFDNVDITYTSPSLAHFAIIHDGIASSCLPEQITLTMHTAAHTVDTAYTGTVTLTSSTANGNWSKTTTSTDAQGTLTPGALDSGTATYTFVAADNGSIVLNLANTNVETLNINITDGLNTENVTEDPDLSFSSLSTVTYRDEFLTASYTNNNGSALWSSDWLEIVEADGAGNGDIQINSGQLQISGSNKGVQRAVDLTGATTATLRLDHRRVSLENGNEYVNLEISSDGGTTWVELDRFKGPQNDISNQLASYNITPYISATTRIRLLGSTNLDSTTDIVYFDNVEIASSSTVTCALIDHFSINYLAGATGTGVNCQAEAITIEAHDAAHATVTTYTGTVNLSASLNNGDWSTTAIATDAQGIFTAGAGDSGTASYTFVAADAGSAILNFKDTHIETTNLNINGAGILETSNTAVAIDDYAITFATSGFIFNNETDTTTIIPTQLSGKDSNVGYNAKTLTLQAVRSSDSDPTQCIAAFQNQTLNVDFAAECKNPLNCIAGQLLNLTSGAVTGTLTATTNDNAAVGSSSYDTRTIAFDVNGKSNIIINYPDAGLIELHARHNILLADGITPSGIYMSGSSSFVVRPLGLSLDVMGQRAADYADNMLLDDSTGTNLSYATDANGTLFKKAGEAFTTTLTAVQWQAADDTDANGIADLGANLTNNIVTQNFGNETTAITPANVSLIQTTTLANAGILTNSANSASFVNGVGTKTISLSEVGIFDLTATLLDYLAVGNNIVTLTPSFGRFVPDHFDTIVIDGCSGGSTFTYSGQPFSVSATAKNTLNSITQNYAGNFAFDTTLSNAGVSPVVNFTNNIIPAANFVNGIGTQANVTYTFSTKETIPETIILRARDADISTGIGITESSTQIRSGRIRVENSYGSELVDMAIPAQVEFYNTDGFEINTVDTCSTVTATLTDTGTDTVMIGDGSIAGQTCIWDDDAESGASNCTFATLLPGPVASQFEAPPIAGSFNLYLKAPGQNFTGDIAVTLTSPTWLQFDWDGDGNHDNDATGIASFGLYRGDDRVIYWREVF